MTMSDSESSDDAEYVESRNTWLDTLSYVDTLYLTMTRPETSTSALLFFIFIVDSNRYIRYHLYQCISEGVLFKITGIDD